MPQLYELAASSMPAFKRLIEISNQETTPNKWNERFSRESLLEGYEHLFSNSPSNNQVASDVIESPNVEISNTETIEETHRENIETVNYDKYQEILESNPSQIISILQETDDPNLLQTLARKLSESIVEKICQHIFESNIESNLPEKFFLTFLPEYFKHQNTRLSIDILAKVYKIYSIQFKSLLPTLIQDSEVNVTILQEFISMINYNEQTKLLNLIIDSDISVNAFIRNIFTIYTLYRNSSKNEKIQNSILKYLQDASEKCLNDKLYGRLMLLYLQNKNDCNKRDVIEKLVEVHQSAFKRPCLNALNEVIKNSTE